MPVQSRIVRYEHRGVVLEGFFAWPSTHVGPLPGILVAHAWVGRNEFACSKALELAKLGYCAFALDMYGDARLGRDKDECASLMAPFVEDRGLLQERMIASLACLRDQPEVDSQRTAAIGFCFGGMCVLDLARTGEDFCGVVSVHGLLTPPGNTHGRPIRAKVLVLHGFDDPMAPAEQLLALGRELTEAAADWQIHAYGGTVHAFTNPQANDPAFGTVYHARADRRSWESLRNFLHEVLN